MNIITFPNSPYRLHQPFEPAGDQPAAIAQLVEGLIRPAITPRSGNAQRDRLRPEEIKALRLREHISQPVFARYLNVSKNLVSDWERGVKKPGGPALRLLALIQKKGIMVIA